MAKETTQECKDRWQKQIKKHLLGKRITNIEYLSDKECEDMDWYSCPVGIELDGKIWLVPIADDEGNNGGSLGTNLQEMPTIPVI